MADPLTDKISVTYHRVDAAFAEDRPVDTFPFLPTGQRVHQTKAAALASAAQDARSQGAPEDARVIIDYDGVFLVDRAIIDWHIPESAGQPGLLRKPGFESFRLSEIPR